jgi:hypothetical protein
VPLPELAPNVEDKHLTVHMIPINLTMVQETAPHASFSSTALILRPLINS